MPVTLAASEVCAVQPAIFDLARPPCACQSSSAEIGGNRYSSAGFEQGVRGLLADVFPSTRVTLPPGFESLALWRAALEAPFSARGASKDDQESIRSAALPTIGPLMSKSSRDLLGETSFHKVECPPRRSSAPRIRDP